MSRILQATVFIFAVTLFGPSAVRAQLIIDVVDIYDEDDFNDNTPDATAPDSIDVDTFTANVLAAFNNDLGGVIDFDFEVLNGIDRIEANFGAGAGETLTLVNGDESTWTTNTGGGRTPISGDNVLGKHCATSPVCTNDHVWEIESVSNGQVVLSMGVTVLSGQKGPFDITVEATLDDGSTVSLEEFLPKSNGLDDTFFAIDAPAGRHITRFAVFNGPPFDDDPDNSGSFGSIDDLAFIVGLVGGGVPTLKAGDADQDFDFDQLDLVKVQITAKYLTGSVATWGEGDWNGAPGGEQGNPPAGDGQFNQLDIIAALAAGTYLTGPYAAINEGGVAGDEQTSLVYDANTGELKVDSPAGKELTSINITSAGNKLIGDKPAVLDGAFDNFGADNIFKATFGSSFGEITFGNVLPTDLSQSDVAVDLTAVGSLAGGGDLGNVDLIYIPEPSSIVLLALGFFGVISSLRRSR